MNSILEDCMLNNEQRTLILQGIKKGREKYQESIASLPDTITKKYTPFLLSDLVNTHVANQILDNPHTQMKVFTKRAGFHPYIVIQDTIRNLFVLITKLPKNKYILTPSGYRGEFSSSNGNRLMEMGMNLEEIYGDRPFQDSLTIGIENQPFGILVCYDSRNDSVYEGALRPDQEDWIYKEDITNCIIKNTKKVLPMNDSPLSDIPLSDIPIKFKTPLEEIVVKFKNKTTT